MSDAEEINRWFVQEVLRHEHVLMAFLRKNWRNPDDVVEFRQEVYAKIIAYGRQQKPANVRAFMLTTARNILINQVRRTAIVSFEQVVHLEDMPLPSDQATPERVALAKDELRRVRAAIGRLPPRCQEVFLLRKVEGLSLQEIAQRTGLALSTVENHLTRGIRGLATIMLETNGEDEARNNISANDTESSRT